MLPIRSHSQRICIAAVQTLLKATPGAYWGSCLKQCCLGSSSVLATAPEATAAAPATAVADDSALAAATRAHGAPATAPATAAVDVLVLLSFV